MPGSAGVVPWRTLPFIDASLRMARVEHTSMQAVQPICSLRLCAQILAW